MLIIYSWPEHLENEIPILIQLFENGLEVFHLRKPDWTKTELENYISKIPISYRNKIVLHQHHELVKKHALKGVHYPEQKRSTAFRLSQLESELSPYKKQGLTISTSIHDINDILPLDGLFDYITVSPIFDSISKEGYKANPDLNVQHLKDKLTTKLIALGGVTDRNKQEALEKGFDGVAVLGFVWSNIDTVVKNFCKINYQ